MGKWAVFSTAEEHKKVGYLITDIKRVPIPVSRESTRTLTSILGNNLIIKFEKLKRILARATSSLKTT